MKISPSGNSIRESHGGKRRHIKTELHYEADEPIAAVGSDEVALQEVPDDAASDGTGAEEELPPQEPAEDEEQDFDIPAPAADSVEPS